MQVQRTEGVNKAVELGCSRENIFIFSDEGVSGAFLERPQLMAALDMIKKRENDISYFICYDSSRLSRNAAHQLIIVDEIKKSGTQLIFLKNNFQDNAEGRFQLTIMAAVDEYERARLKLRTEMGKRAKACQHMLTHNPGTYGYNFDQRTDMLNINEDHANNLKNIFAMLIEEHKSPSEIAEKLNDLCVPSPRMKQWSRVTVRRILSNPSYLGTLYIRRYDTRECHFNKYKKRGEKVKVKERPQNEWIPVEIPQIIDKDTWEKAQEVLKKARHLREKRCSEDFILASLLRCGICGSTMSGKTVAKGSTVYRYYICQEKYKGVKGKECKAALVKAEDIEKAVWERIYSSICIFMTKELNMYRVIEKYIADRQNEIKNIFKKKEKTNFERERIIAMFRKGYIKEDEFTKMLEFNMKLFTSLDGVSKDRNAENSDLEERLKKDCKERKLHYNIEDTICKLNSTDKRYIYRLLISEITVEDNTTIIKGKF